MVRKFLLLFTLGCFTAAFGCDDDPRDDGNGGSDGDADGDADSDADADTENYTSSLVGEIERDGNYVLELTDGTDTILFEVGAENGGLILTFALNGENILAENAEMNGSIFWVAPQSLWGWPPPSALDFKPFSVEVDPVTPAVTLTSETDTKLNIQVVKRFTPDRVNFAILQEYTIINTGTESASFAPWEVSRVLPGGVTFFPSGSEVNAVDMTELSVTEVDGISWLDHTVPLDPGNYKYCADGTGGWLAHASGSSVFVKTFADQPASLKPPGQGEIQLYVKGGGYEEVEQMGPYLEIPPGGQATWALRWFLRPLPPGASAAVGDGPLVDFVDSLVP